MTEFLNPYSFIPLPVKKSRYKKEDGVYTGVIHYTITTKTPTFIPNTSSERAFKKTDLFYKKMCEERNRQYAESHKHNSYDFFSYTNLDKEKSYDEECHEPVIPGSELRGVIRSVYETLTDSCMSSLNGDTILSKRIPEPFHPALIKKTGERYELFEAKRLQYEAEDENTLTYNSKGIFEGQEMYFDKSSIFHREDGNTFCIKMRNCSNNKSDETDTTGFILKGEKGVVIRKDNGRKEELKKHAGLFYLIEDEDGNVLKVCDVTKEDLQGLERVIKSYQGSYGAYSKALTKFVKGSGKEYFPVYYSVVKDSFDDATFILYLSPASITKEVYKHTIADIAGDFKPCTGDVKCPTCALFGRVDKKAPITSRIRFSDARIPTDKKKKDKGAYYCNNGKPVTLEVLGGPKPGNTEFYLQKPENASFWTYDYYVDNNKKIHIQDYQAKLRGRKFYWHWNWNKNFKIPQVDCSNQNKTVRVLNSEITFEADLFFDKISKRELKRLIWILNSANASGEPLVYKIGSGKPLGLGSIECKVINYHIRTIKYDPMTSILAYEEEQKEPETLPYVDERIGFSSDKNVKNSFFAACSKNTFEDTIAYPFLENQKPHPLSNGFKWYMKNRNTSDVAPRTDYRIYKSLPLATDNKRTLLCDPIPGLTYTDRGNPTPGKGSLTSGNVYKAIIVGFDDTKKTIKVQIKETTHVIPFKDFDRTIRDYNKFKKAYRKDAEVDVKYTKPILGTDIKIEVAKDK